MKLKRQTVEEWEADVVFPHYSRIGDLFYYKVLSETKMIKIINGFDDNISIESTEYLIDSAFRIDAIIIDKMEFESKFNEIFNKINTISNG